MMLLLELPKRAAANHYAADGQRRIGNTVRLLRACSSACIKVRGQVLWGIRTRHLPSTLRTPAMLPALTLLLSAALGPGEPAQAKVLPPAVGATVPSFSLQDMHRRLRALDKFKDKKAFVVVFIGAECKVSNLCLPTLIDLHKQYADKGVQVLLINANWHEPFVTVSAHAQERELPFPVLKDFDQQVADQFGAKRTPEAFLLDAQRVIRYHGRIDDQYGVNFERAKASRPDLQEAIDQLLAGKAIMTPQTEASGCLITRATRPRVEGEITYTKHVAAIVQKRCQECHRPGEIGPFSLLTYEQAKARSQWIQEVVLEQRMPPWHADPRHGHFVNDRRLTSEERDLLLAWIEKGCPKGDDKDMPPPRQFVEGWKIGTPDAVFRMDEEFKVPASGVLDYQRFTVDPGFKEDVWVQAAECRPGNRAVVHHILVYVQTPGSLLYDADGKASTLAGWAPGDMPAIFKPGTARLIPAGAKFIFEVHYTPNGTAQADRSSVGLLFAKKRPEHMVETNILANMRLKVPARAASHTEQMVYTFKGDAMLLSFMPHMHWRGVSAKYVATYPDGRTETLLSVPDYDFNWQSVYRFAEPLAIPKGTKLTWTCTWDNSADNPRNPDPSKEIRWGLQTWDEMQNGWMDLVWTKPGKGP
jgi:peroxiredoxin